MMNKIKKERCLAIIPARSGSKRVKDKNFIQFFGKKMYEHTYIAAEKSNLFADIVISTDKKSIKKHKITQSYERPLSLCKGSSELADVVAHALKYYEKKHDVKYDYICLLWATSPLRSEKDIIKSFEKLKKKKANAVVGVTEYYLYPGCAVKVDKKGFLAPLTPKLFWLSSQERPEIFTDCGSFSWIKRDVFLKEKTWFPKRSIPYVLPYFKGVDLDEPKHFELLKFYYKEYKK
jgi:CMP-N-acetylneuraminic acid synthetase